VPLIAKDLGGLWFPSRLHTAVVYGDGPEVAGLTLLPIALLLVDRAFEKRRAAAWFAAAIGIITVLLTNIPAAMALAMALGAYALAGDPRGWLARIAAIVGSALAGYLLVARWLPPSGMRLAMVNAQWMDSAGSFNQHRLFSYGAIGIAVLAAAYLLWRTGAPSHLRFAVLFTLITAVVTLGKYWFDVSLLAQPTRFQLVMEMALVLALAFAIVPWVLRWKVATGVAAALLLAASVAQVNQHRWFARRTIVRADISQRSETRIAHWMEAHANGARVMTGGTTAFWLNVSTATQQLIGCCDQNVLLTRASPIAKWEIGSDDAAGDRGAEISIAWLQSLGAHYVVVSGRNSTDVYKEFLHPHKFDGILREVWHNGDDVIFAVPPEVASLAHVIRLEESILVMPENGADIGRLARYNAALLDPAHPKASLVWTGTDRATIVGEVPRGYVLSIQVPYHFGWRAAVGGRSVRIGADAMGLMQLAPDCGGACTVELVFDGGLERRVLTWLTVLAWMAGITALVMDNKFEQAEANRYFGYQSLIRTSTPEPLSAASNTAKSEPW
jgi:hypothetical protein